MKETIAYNFLPWLMVPTTLCSVVELDDYRKIMKNIESYKLITADAVTQNYFNKYNTLFNKVSGYWSTPEICLWGATRKTSNVEHVCHIAVVKMLESHATSEFQDPTTIGSRLTPYRECYQKSTKNVSCCPIGLRKQVIFCPPTYVFRTSERSRYEVVNGFYLGAGDDRINSAFIYKLSNGKGDAMNLMYYMYDIMETDPIVINSIDYHSIKHEPEMNLKISGVKLSTRRFNENEIKGLFSISKQTKKDFCNLEKDIESLERMCKYLAVAKHDFSMSDDNRGTSNVASDDDATDRSGFVPFKCVERHMHYEKENHSHSSGKHFPGKHLPMIYCPNQIFRTNNISRSQQGFFFSAGDHEKSSAFLYQARIVEVDGVRTLSGIFLENYVTW